MTFKELSQLLYSLGDLHKRECGKLMPELYKTGINRLLIVCSAMLDKTNSFLRNSDISSEQKTEIVEQLGVAVEGMLKLGMINKNTPDTLIQLLLNNFESLCEQNLDQNQN
jgi:hypothetical protein